MTDPVEKWIEQEADRHEQRPAQHPTRERHVEQHERREDDRVVKIEQGREAEERSQDDPGGELPRRALGVQRAEQRLDQLDEGEHALALPLQTILGDRQNLPQRGAPFLVTRAAEPSLEHRQNRFLGPADRKSTRLNSSHVEISYAVFCLKKKKSK